MYSRGVLNEVALKAKIESIMLDIIELKQENRDISNKVRSIYRNLDIEAQKPIGESETAGYTYKYRLMRDFKTIGYFRKLQKVNSRLINKHRSKVRSLRVELDLLKGAD